MERGETRSDGQSGRFMTARGLRRDLAPSLHLAGGAAGGSGRGGP